MYLYPKTIGEWPAKPLLTFLRQLTDGDALLRIQGGTPALVNKLIEGIEIHNSSAITQVKEQDNGVLIENALGEQRIFDRVIVATPTNKIETFLNNEQFAADIALLKKFKFEQGQLVIHTDQSVMPPKRKDWAVLSYMMDRKFTRQQFTVWFKFGRAEPGG